MTFDPNNPGAFLDSVNPPAVADDDDPAAFDQFLESLSDTNFNYPSANGNPVPNEPDPDDEPDDDVEPDEPPVMPPPAPAGTVRIGDKDVPLGEVQALYELGQMFREGKLQPGAQPVQPAKGEERPTPPPEPVVIPDFIDQDNPASMQLWEYLQSEKQSWQTELNQTRESASRAEQALRERLAQENTQAAVSQFRQQYSHLSDDEMTTILTLAGPMIGTFVQQYQSPVEGLKRAFYVAALDNPSTRDRVLDTAAKSASQQSKSRKQKLSSISGSSNGRAPTQPRPVVSNDRQATEEFAKGLAEAYQTNGRIN